MTPFIKYFIYAILGYIAVSILFHAWLASQVTLLSESDKKHHRKLEEMHRKLDELGWATKQGIRQARQDIAEHEWQAHTGMTAI